MIELQYGSSLSSLWDEKLEKVLDRMSALAWTQPHPVVVVTPSMAQAQALKDLMWRRNSPMIGVEFWQPDNLRGPLARHFQRERPLADLDLIEAGLRGVAHECAQQDPQNATAAALSRSARALAKTLIMLRGAGWKKPEAFPADTFPPGELLNLTERFIAQCQTQGIELADEFDFSVLQRAKQDSGKEFGRLLLVGFDGMHWEHWPILAASALLAQDALVLLPVPCATAVDTDTIWCSSWEQLAGKEASPVPDTPPAHAHLGRLADHVDRLDQKKIEQEADLIPVKFYAAASQIDEARRVALLAADLLAQGSTRIGVLVPGPGALARELTLALERAGIHHFTSFPGKASPVPHGGSWAALLRALGTGSVESLGAFLRSNASILGIEADPLARSMESLASQWLVGDTTLLRPLTEASASELTAFWAIWPDLPGSGSLAFYLGQIHDLLARFGWEDLAFSVAELQQQQDKVGQLVLSRDSALDWLATALPARRVHRTPHNGNPYAFVQILSPTDAVGRDWDHLFFCGQAEGIWPPPMQPADYLGPQAVQNLNATATGLNEQATRMGDFGEGTAVVKEGFGYCLGPLDERACHLRNWINLLRTTSGSVTLGTARIDETDSNRELQPGEFFRRAYLACTGKPADPATLVEIDQPPDLPTWLLYPKSDPIDTTQIMTAWKERQTGSSLSEYEFTLGGEPASFEPKISASAWGNAFARPAQVFLASYLGVHPPSTQSVLNLRLAMGNWAHRFVEQAAGQARPGDPDDWEEQCSAAAEATIERMTRITEECGRPLPAWWMAVVRLATSQARDFAREIGQQSQGGQVLVERTLPLTAIPLPSGRRLRVKGRMDALVAEGPVTAGDPLNLAGGKLEVWDFKTGSAKPLQGLKSLEKREGIQLALYLIGLKNSGAASISGGLKMAGVAWKTQLTLEEVESSEGIDLLERLALMQDEGKFGWRGTVRDPFNPGAPYPMATLPAPNLEAKFKATHDL